jgi:hypothetical protein
LRHLSADPIQTDCTKVVYLLRSQLDLMKFICSNVHNDISKGLQREYYVYFVPRRSVACEKVNIFWQLMWLNNLSYEFNDLNMCAFALSIFLVMQVLEEEKVHHLITIGECPLYIVPLEEDVLSFELDLAYKVWKKLLCLLAVDLC